MFFVACQLLEKLHRGLVIFIESSVDPQPALQMAIVVMTIEKVAHHTLLAEVLLQVDDRISTGRPAMVK